MSIPGETVKGNFIFVDFLALDTTAFEFGPPKLNDYKSRLINLTYRGKQLYVKFPRRDLPFGINIKTPLENATKGASEEKENNAKGYDVAWSLAKDYSDESSVDNAYYQKGLELDNFFIAEAFKNRSKWLEMSEDPEDEKFQLKQIKGLDNYGEKGIWKRILKWSRKAGTDKQKPVNLDYAPRINSSFKVQFEKEGKDTIKKDPETGRNKCKFTTKFFREKNVPITDVNESNYDKIVPKYSGFSMLCRWSRLTASNAWLVLKSEIEQCVVYPRQQLDLTENYLDDGEGSDEEEAEKPNTDISYLDDEEEKPIVVSKIQQAINSFDDDADVPIEETPKTTGIKMNSLRLRK